MPVVVINPYAFAAAGGSGIALVSHVETALGVNGGTSGAIDTTGANLITVAVAYYNGAGATVASITDSKGNTYTARTNQGAGGGEAIRMFDCASPTVGSGHTFTVGTANSYSAICVLAFSGANAAPFDKQSTAAATQPGSITPAVDNSVVVSAASGLASGIPTPNGGFTSFGVDFGAGVNCCGAIGYLIQTTAAAANPTWSSPAAVTAIAAYKP